jgi:hypothetical protein
MTLTLCPQKENRMSVVVRETSRLLAEMNPALTSGEFVFRTTKDPDLASLATPRALGLFREAEGTSLILGRADAVALGFDGAMPMRRIVLEIWSALDSVGLTAAVSSALSVNGIPCNVVAAYHHDYIFVPAAMADRALAILRKVQADAAAET